MHNYNYDKRLKVWLDGNRKLHCAQCTSSPANNIQANFQFDDRVWTKGPCTANWYGAVNWWAATMSTPNNNCTSENTHTHTVLYCHAMHWTKRNGTGTDMQVNTCPRSLLRVENAVFLQWILRLSSQAIPHKT